ncbi:hypothetical protein FIBSPDRAFT_853653, partial [Athelia psychrophila]
MACAGGAAGPRVRAAEVRGGKRKKRKVGRRKKARRKEGRKEANEGYVVCNMHTVVSGMWWLVVHGMDMGLWGYGYMGGICGGFCLCAAGAGSTWPISV